VIEIGASLAQARDRLGLGIAEAQKETKLRARYLRALEQEQFDQLPPGSYRRSFLRTYATFLGLDADLLVEQYAARYEKDEETQRTPAPPPSPVWRPRHRLRGGALAAAAVGVALLAILLVLLTHGRSGTRPRASGSRATTAGSAASKPQTNMPRHTAPTQAKTTPVTPKPPAASLSLDAVGGACWLSVHTGSAQGPIAYEGTLQQGQRVSLHETRFWARLGAPWNLSLTINGKAQTLPRVTGNVIIDAHGIKTAR
jgi:cytoskeletal protein RodZ